MDELYLAFVDRMIYFEPQPTEQLTIQIEALGTF